MHIPMAYIYSSIYSLCWIDAIVPSLFQVETTKKCLQTLTNIPSGTKSPLVEKHCFKLWQKSKRIPLQSYFSFPLKFTQNSFWKPTFFPFISENVINLWQICVLTFFVWEMNPVDSHLPASSIAHPKLLSPTVCSKGRKSPFLFKRGSFILSLWQMGCCLQGGMLPRSMDFILFVSCSSTAGRGPITTLKGCSSSFWD